MKTLRDCPFLECMRDRHKALPDDYQMKPDVPNCLVNGHYNVTQYQGILYVRLGSPEKALS